MGALGRGGIFQFDGFRLDCSAGALFRRREDGSFVPMVLGSRALDVLDVLVGHAGDLVSRDEFMAAVWPATVVEDTNLNMQIAALRRILDEGRANGSCIQTIPGRGYRFALPVARVEFSLPLASGRPSGNGTAGPIAEQPRPRNPAAACGPGNTPPLVPPRERKWLWCGSLGLVVGALCLVGAVVTASNWHWPQPAQARPAPRLSIVVLPFTDLGDDRDAHDLANGVTEDLTTDLSLVPDFLVTSRHSAFTYGSKLVDTKQVGRELSVRYVLDGSIQRSGNQLRINAQLIDAETDTQLWAERFDRDAGDLPALQNEITSRIAVALNSVMLNTETSRLTDRPDALGYILQARAIWWKPRKRDNYTKGIGLLEHALALDPSSIEAQAQLGQALVSRAHDQMTVSPAADIERAKGLLAQALAATPWDPEAHFGKAQLRRLEGRCDAAIPEYETVIALRRNMVPAYRNLGNCKLFTGSIEETISLEQRAVRISPRDPLAGFMYWRIGTAHLLLSHVDEAIMWFEKKPPTDDGKYPGSPGSPVMHAWLASGYALKGEVDRAAAELFEARSLSDNDSYSSIARLKATGYWGVPKVRALFEATYFAGLRKAGVPEE